MCPQCCESHTKILVVDDDADARAATRVMLEAAPRHYDIEEASAGEQALRMAVNSKPDLVLLDIVLSDVNGVAVLQALKRNPTTHNAKVILVTAHAEQRMIRTGLVCGADDYVTKPFTREKLLNLVERFTSR